MENKINDAMWMEEKGKFNTALEIYSVTLQNKNQTNDVVVKARQGTLRICKKLKEKGEFRRTQSLYQHIITDYPASTEAVEAQEGLLEIAMKFDMQNQPRRAGTILKDLIANGINGNAVNSAKKRLSGECDYNLERKKYLESRQQEKLKLVKMRLDEAKYQQRNGKYISAIATYRDLLKEGPLNREYVDDACSGLLSIGRMLNGIGEYRRAATIYQEIIESNQSSREALQAQVGLIEVAMHFEEQRQYIRANTVFNDVIDNNINEEAIKQAKEELMRMKQVCVKPVNKNDKGEKLKLIQRKLDEAKGQESNGRYTSALSNYRVIFKEGPQDITQVEAARKGMMRIAKTMKEMGEYRRVSTLFQEIIENNPSCLEASDAQDELVEIAKNFEEKGQPSQAVTILNNIIDNGINENAINIAKKKINNDVMPEVLINY